MVRLGGYSVRDADNIVRLDSNSAPAGAFIDFADTLGGDTSANLVRLDGLYRFTARHGLGMSWYAFRLRGEQTLDTAISWGGQVYPVNAAVASELEFDVYKLNYQYSLFRNDEVELGALFGLHVMRTSASLEASGISQSLSDSVTAPLPVWGLFASYKFTPRWSAYYNYQFFFINYEDKVQGGLQDFLIGTEYRLLPNFAVGVALNAFGMNLESKKEATTMYLETNWSGAMLYGSAYF